LKGVIEKKNQFTKRTKWSNKKSKDQIEKKLKKIGMKNEIKNNKDTIGKKYIL